MSGGGNGDCTRSIVRTVSTGCEPPSVLRPGCCCYMQEIAPVDYWHQAPQFLSRGAQTFWHRAYSIITSRTTSVLYLNLKRGRMCWNLSCVRLKVILCLSSFMQWFDEPCCPTWRNSINMSNQQVRSLVNDFLKLNGQPLAFSLKRVNNERKDNWFSFHAAPRVSTNIYTKRAYIRVCIKPPRAKKNNIGSWEPPHMLS